MAIEEKPRPLSWFVAKDFIFQRSDSEPKMHTFCIEAPEKIVIEGRDYVFDRFVLASDELDIEIARDPGFGHVVSRFRLSKTQVAKVKLQALFTATKTAVDAQDQALLEDILVSIPLKLIPAGITERPIHDVEKDFKKTE